MKPLLRFKRSYFDHRGSFRGVFAYEWATRRAFTTRRALWRAWWWVFIRRYECEICSECGRPVGQVWTAPDSVWSSVMPGPGGVLCVSCFDMLYERKTGRSLRWVPRDLTAPIADLRQTIRAFCMGCGAAVSGRSQGECAARLREHQCQPDGSKS